VGSDSWGLLAALLLVAAAIWAVAELGPEGLLLLPFATVHFAEHAKWCLVLAFLVLTVIALRRRLGEHLRGSPGPA
jgi:hypothetical protein